MRCSLGSERDLTLESNLLIFITKENFLNIEFVLYYVNAYTTHSLCKVSLKSWWHQCCKRRVNYLQGQMVVFSLPLSPYPHPHLPTTFRISFIFFFVLVLKERYLHLHTTLALAHAPRTFPFSNGLLVGNYSNKKNNQPGFPAIFLPVCNHPSSPDLGRYPKATTPCKTQPRSGHGPIPRPPGQEALRASPAGSPAAHAQPALPPTRSPAQLLSSEFCAARRGYSRSFPSTSRPSFPIRAWPEAVRQKQAAKGRKMGELGNGHLSSRFPQTLCLKSVSERNKTRPQAAPRIPLRVSAETAGRIPQIKQSPQASG